MNKKYIKIAALSFAALTVTATIIYAVVSPDMGVVYQNPTATLGIGLVGLGLCMESRKQQSAKEAADNKK